MRIGPIEVIPEQRLLLVGGRRQPIGARAFDVLVQLCRHHGKVVSKSDLIAAVWPDSVVEENNLAAQVSAVRRVLGHDAVVTVAGRGYCLVLGGADAPPLDAAQQEHVAREQEPSSVDVSFAWSAAPVLAFVDLDPDTNPPEAVARHWPAFAEQAARALAVRYGARVDATGRASLVASFATAPEAVLGARALRGLWHECAGSRETAPSNMRVVLTRGPRPRPDDPSATAAARSMLEHCSSASTLASAEVVEELAVGVDVVVEDIGECPLGEHAGATRVFQLKDAESMLAPPAHLSRALVASGSPDLHARIAVLTPETAAACAPLAHLVADELAFHLGANATVELISRLSLRHTKGVAPDLLLQAVGARYAITGTCLEASGRACVSLEMTDLSSGACLWRNVLRVSTASLVAEPGTALARCAGEILGAVSSLEARRVNAIPLASLESYSLLLGGVRLMHRLSRSDFARAHDAMSMLTERHPTHPDGYAWLAKWHILETHQGWAADPEKSAARARGFAERALERDDRCALAMVVSGMVKAYSDHDLDAAGHIYDAALEQHPNDALAWVLKGMVHAFRGEGEEAVRHTRHASTLSPLDPHRYYFDSLGASAEAAAGRYDLAVELAERSLRANSMHASTLRILAIARAMRGELEAARAAVGRVLALDPDFSVERFLAHSPSADYEIGRRFADALRQAGAPLRSG